MTTKDTNPKDALGARKASAQYTSGPARYEWGLAQLDGACKYRGWNWRDAGVKASIYIEAIDRHLTQYKEGEDRDPKSAKSMVHHLGAIMACASIMLDAHHCGKLIDDRGPALPEGWLDQFTDRACAILDHYGDKALPPYTNEELHPPMMTLADVDKLFANMLKTKPEVIDYGADLPYDEALAGGPLTGIGIPFAGSDDADEWFYYGRDKRLYGPFTSAGYAGEHRDHGNIVGGTD